MLEDVKYSQGSILVSLLFLRCIDEFPQTVVSGNVLPQLSKIITQLKLEGNYLENSQVWVTGFLMINFKTKILIGNKHKHLYAEALNIIYDGNKIKQYTKVKYIGCILEESLFGESVTSNVIDKVNSRLNFLHLC